MYREVQSIMRKFGGQTGNLVVRRSLEARQFQIGANEVGTSRAQRDTADQQRTKPRYRVKAQGEHPLIRCAVQAVSFSPMRS